jgi:3-hydroxyacyl-CoA dehydrogenase
MLDPYIRQALFLVDEGATPAQVDKAMEKFGMNMGPFRMCDLVGNDVMGSIRQRQRQLYPGKFYSPSADWISEQGRFGQKAGKGWYDYVPGARAPVPAKEVLAMIEDKRKELGLVARKISDAEIIARCTYALANEGAKILQEGIAERASDIDMVYLSGYGFPAFRGGPMQYADEVGAFNIVQAMARFAANPHGDPAFWQAAQLLADLAAKGGKFNA